jgi:hypothetical protein
VALVIDQQRGIGVVLEEVPELRTHGLEGRTNTLGVIKSAPVVGW